MPSRPPCPAVLSLLTSSLVFLGCKAQGAGLACVGSLQPSVELLAGLSPSRTRRRVPPIYLQVGLRAGLQWEPRVGGG